MEEPKPLHEQIDSLLKNQRQQLDVDLPDDAVWERLSRKLENSQADSASDSSDKKGGKEVKLKPWNRRIAAAAAVVFLLTAVGTLLYELKPDSAVAIEEDTYATLYESNPKLAEVETHFTSEVNSLKGQIQQVQLAVNKEEDHTAFLTDLEQAYETLKTNALESGMNEQVIHAMINNYRLRITLLERLLTELEDAQMQRESQSSIQTDNNAQNQEEI